MSVRNEEVIPATTEAATSNGFTGTGTQAVVAGVLVDDEKVTIEYTHNGTDWQELMVNGVTQTIDINHSFITVLGPVKFRCVKSITTNSVSVNLWITEAE